MAGPYTHLTIAHGAMLDGRLPESLAGLLQIKASFVYIGALAPDMPYAALDKELSDLYHRRHTGDFLGACMNSLRSRRAGGEYSQPSLDAMEAWIYGYASHLVVDTFLHPITEATVGKLSEQLDPVRHRECEMAQDTLLVSEVHVKGTEICSGAYSSTLRMALDSDEYSDVAELWESVHDEVYGELEPDTGPRLWIPSFVEIVEMIESGQAVQHFTRHIHSDAGGHVRYVKSDALRSDRPDLVADYYEHVHMPDGNAAHFLTGVFPLVIDAVVGLWDLLEAALASPEDEIEIRFDSWDLDRGVEVTSDELVFWKA